MSNEQFIFWLNGFVKAVNEEGPTPGQWGIIVSELSKVAEPISYNTNWPNKIYPADPYRVTCTTSTAYKANLPEEDYNLPSTID